MVTQVQEICQKKKTQKTYTHIFYTYPFQGHGVSGEQPGHDRTLSHTLTYRQLGNSSYFFKKEALGQWGKNQERICELHREAQVNQEVQSQKLLAVKQRCSINH